MYIEDYGESGFLPVFLPVIFPKIYIFPPYGFQQFQNLFLKLLHHLTLMSMCNFNNKSLLHYKSKLSTVDLLISNTIAGSGRSCFHSHSGSRGSLFLK